MDKSLTYRLTNQRFIGADLWLQLILLAECCGANPRGTPHVRYPAGKGEMSKSPHAYAETIELITEQQNQFAETWPTNYIYLQ
jgi:hypothetical protein